MRAGALRNRITLQSRSATRDAMGGEVINWIDQATVPASVEPLMGREFLAAEQVQSQVSIRFRIRYYPGVTSDWRIVWEERHYDIVEIIDIKGRHVELQLMAKTQKN